MTSKPILNCILTKNLPILEQLKIEEALTRTSNENWCIINQGSAPAIVLGISQKPEEMINISTFINHSEDITLIRRFSGGGTVIVDEHTLFVSFIFQKNSDICSPSPQALLEWTSTIYNPVFSLHNFSIQAQDYAIGPYKVGGNAQYITKSTLLHHTSFLWDFTHERMNLLRIPEKQPEWRRNRTHENFLSPLKHYFPTPDSIIDRIKNSLEEFFTLTCSSIEHASAMTHVPHRKATTLLTLDVGLVY